MTEKDLLARYDACNIGEKGVLALLALYTDAMNKTTLIEHLRHAGIQDKGTRAYTPAILGSTLERLINQGFVNINTGFLCNEELVWPAIRDAIAHHFFEPLCHAIESLSRDTGNRYYRFNYRELLCRLRMALLRGEPPQKVYRWLDACLGDYETRRRHPYVVVCGSPFVPEMIERFHPELQYEILVYFLRFSENSPEMASAVITSAERHLKHFQHDDQSESLSIALTESLLLCGRLNDAQKLIAQHDDSRAQFLRASIMLLRGDHDIAVSTFNSALKTMRKEYGKRNLLIPGCCG